jgi:hypothetical protein
MPVTLPTVNVPTNATPAAIICIFNMTSSWQTFGGERSDEA